ncbi:hypothetical protein ACP70R_031130 [Stipagrostis hirtigluma subsp. patula]
MEEEWRELARTVPTTLLEVFIGRTDQVNEMVDAARRKVTVSIYLARMSLIGVLVPENVVENPPPAGQNFSQVLEIARRRLHGLLELHASAGHVLVLYGAHVGLLQQGGPRWQNWEAHRADALDHAAEAMQRLRTAVSCAEASIDAIRVLGSFLPPSPDWNAWASATLNLYRRAMWAATMARLALHRMRGAITLEFFDALMIVYTH